MSMCFPEQAKHAKTDIYGSTNRNHRTTLVRFLLVDPFVSILGVVPLQLTLCLQLSSAVSLDPDQSRTLWFKKNSKNKNHEKNPSMRRVNNGLYIRHV